MSKRTDEFEHDLVSMIEKYIGKSIPHKLPDFLDKEGVKSGAKIMRVEGIGSKSKDNKTDVIVYLEDSEPIKISVKLGNADYFGNWYGHKRFLQEFGENAFKRMTVAATEFANEWLKTATAPYVGVSICFGRRTGRTGKDFLDIFNLEDLLTIARGYGDSDATANCMYISDKICDDIEDLISQLREISIKTINEATESFKVAFRPINPLTEGTNRGKNVYTRFQPYKKLDTLREITSVKELRELGCFVEVEPNCLNHNHILDELANKYNILIPRK